MIVDRERHEACLTGLAAAVDDPNHGIHGPGSLAWELGREALNFVGGGRAALLQLAHPAVAFAIEEHSAARSDTKGRFQRTFAYVLGMVFGPLDEALRSARRVHRIHERITGSAPEAAGSLALGQAYHANEKAALAWVWATLVDSVFAVHERLLRPLSLASKERYLEETRRFALLFGLEAQDLPESYLDFKHYFNRMLAGPELAVTDAARETARALFEPPTPALAPVFQWYRGVTAELLPRPLARAFALRRSGSVRASMRLFGALYPQLPARVRFLPHYVDAQRRVGVAMADPHRLSLWSLMQRVLGS